MVIKPFLTAFRRWTRITRDIQRHLSSSYLIRSSFPEEQHTVQIWCQESPFGTRFWKWWISYTQSKLYLLFAWTLTFLDVLLFLGNWWHHPWRPHHPYLFPRLTMLIRLYGVSDKTYLHLQCSLNASFLIALASSCLYLVQIISTVKSLMSSITTLHFVGTYLVFLPLTSINLVDN